jgi:hypothetical protein
VLLDGAWDLGRRRLASVEVEVQLLRVLLRPLLLHMIVAGAAADRR